MKTGDMATAFMAGLLLTVAIINICSSNKQKKDKLPIDKRQELKQLLAQHVENENYEQAAQVRDELAELNKKPEVEA